MSNKPIDNDQSQDEQLHDQVVQLLTKAGPRIAPPPRMQAEVRAAVHAEWQHMIESRKAQRRNRWLAAAALLLIMIGGTWFATQLRTPMPGNATTSAIIASIDQAEQNATLNETPRHTQLIHSGDTLHTQTQGGMRVSLNSGISLRIAANSVLRFVDAEQLQLSQGRIYLDSHDKAAALVVSTPYGKVTHLGTRYFVDTESQALRVAVRSGHVAIHTEDSQLTVNAMEQVQLGADRQIVRGILNLEDARWQWADALAEPFVLENRSVADFIRWVADETGYELSYANNAVKAAADHTILHGQRTTLPPLQSLSVVLATTDFHASTQDRQLRITQQQ